MTHGCVHVQCIDAFGDICISINFWSKGCKYALDICHDNTNAVCDSDDDTLNNYDVIFLNNNSSCFAHALSCNDGTGFRYLALFESIVVSLSSL